MLSFPSSSVTFAALTLMTAPALALQGGPGGPGGAGSGGGGNAAIIAYLDTLPLETVDAYEEVDLVHMREEEKLARDVYTTLFQYWGVSTFDNIAKSEQGHMDLTLYLFDRYGLADPLLSDTVGVFPSAEFGVLYDKLTAFGLVSEVHAYIVGALIEDLDIYDLDFTLAGTDNRDIATVWQNLSRGSRNHMRAFYGQLYNLGLFYPGYFIPTWRVDEIVTSPTETQPVDENGDVLP